MVSLHPNSDFLRKTPCLDLYCDLAQRHTADCIKRILRVLGKPRVSSPLMTATTAALVEKDWKEFEKLASKWKYPGYILREILIELMTSINFRSHLVSIAKDAVKLNEIMSRMKCMHLHGAKWSLFSELIAFDFFLTGLPIPQGDPARRCKEISRAIDDACVATLVEEKTSLMKKDDEDQESVAEGAVEGVVSGAAESVVEGKVEVEGEPECEGEVEGVPRKVKCYNCYTETAPEPGQTVCECSWCGTKLRVK